MIGIEAGAGVGVGVGVGTRIGSGRLRLVRLQSGILLARLTLLKEFKEILIHWSVEVARADI